MWLRGQTNASKVHTLKCAAYNLGLLLRKVWGLSKPRNAEETRMAWLLAIMALLVLVAVMTGRNKSPLFEWLLGTSGVLLVTQIVRRSKRFIHRVWKNLHFSTGW